MIGAETLAAFVRAIERGDRWQAADLVVATCAAARGAFRPIIRAFAHAASVGEAHVYQLRLVALAFPPAARCPDLSMAVHLAARRKAARRGMTPVAMLAQAR